MNKASEAQKRYDENNTRRYQLKLNNKTDRDIIERLDRVGSMQGYIRDLIRADIAKDAGIRQVYQIIDATIEEVNEMFREGDVEYNVLFKSDSVGTVLRELDGMKKTDGVCVEIFRENEDEDFVDGTDYDTVENFRKRESFRI